MLTLKQKQPGFTIVELLIVIVVIAILATISVVSYRGIQQRAVTVAYTSAVDQWDKFLQMEIALAGTLPPFTGGVCLGRATTDFPEGDGFDAEACLTEEFEGVSGSITYNSSYLAGFQNKSIPISGLLPKTNYTNSANGRVYAGRGVILISNASIRMYVLQWIPQVSGQCGRGAGSASATPGALTGDICTLIHYY